jgi:murein DD-endopeptidase MepM/ murein hydrolase activator NlpD
MMKSASFTSILLAALLCLPAQPQTGAQNPLTVTLEPEQILNGAPCVFRVASAARITVVTGTWMERRLIFNYEPKTESWYALAGVNLDTAPGSYPLALETTLASGEVVSSTYKVPIGRARYVVTTLRVARKFTDPDPATLARIKQEQAVKQEVFNRFTAMRLWEGQFTAPLAAVTTEPFGVQRTFNGVRQSIHQGLDYRAETGTPLSAMNSGKVILAREFFYEGNFVVLDHGHGLLTLYLHLSEFKVKEGESVKRGQVIGLSGASGRTTGPHLHVGARWQGIYVDPARLLQLNLPQ